MITFVFSLAVAAAQPAPTLVVVLPFAGGADAALKDGVADELRKDVGALPGYATQSKRTTAEHIATASALGLDCARDKPACMLKLGGIAGGAVVISGSIEATNAALVALDVERSKVIARRTMDLPSDAKLRADAVKLLAVRLLAPGLERGAIEVSVRQKGATVRVDGLTRGISPLAKPVDVVPGKHTVDVSLAGFDSVSTTIDDVKFDETAHWTVELKPSPADAAAGAPLVSAAAGDDVKIEDDTVSAPAAAAPTSSSAEADKKKFKRIAVYELDTGGLGDATTGPRTGRVVTEALLAELRKREGLSVVGTDEIKAMLDHEANRQLAGCNVDAGCLAEIAGALGADIVVIGSLARVGEESLFGLRRIEQKTAQVAAQQTKHLKPADGEEFIAAVGPVVHEMFGDFPLHKGEREGAPPELALRVHPPPLPPWAFWSTAAGGGVLALTAATAGAFNLASLSSYNSDLAQKPTVDGGQLRRDGDVVDATAWGFYGAIAGAAVVGAAAGVAALFTDWWGYGDDASKS